MENTATVTDRSLSATPRPARLLDLPGKLALAGLRALGGAGYDPIICSVYWMGATPAVWASRK